MTYTFYILSFQIFLSFYLLFLLWSESLVIYFGCLILFLQTITIFLVIFNRVLISGFSISFFLYIVLIPVILPYISKKLSKRNPESTLKKLAFRFHKHLDASFFNILIFNKGLFYLSRKFFVKNEQFFRDLLKTSYRLRNFFILYPWMFFIGFLIVEIILYKKIYFSAIFLSINILIYRLFLLLLRIIEYSSVEYLQYINTQYFLSSLKETSLSSFFINSENLTKILDNVESSEESYLINKWIVCFSSITYASSYSSAYVLRKYLCFYYRNLLNCITLIIVFLGFIFENLEKYPFLSNFVPLMIFFIIYIFSFFISRTKFSTVNSLFKHLIAVRLTFLVYRNELIERNFVSSQNILNISILTPPAWSWKPKNFSEFFSDFENKNFYYKFFKKPLIFIFVKNFLYKNFWLLFLFFIFFTFIAFWLYILLRLIFDIICWFFLF